MNKPIIKIEGLAKAFDAPNGAPSLPVFDDFWLKIDKGEFVCLIGHSGCGKTTLLNILAGLDKATEGVILANGQPVDGPSLERAVIFQSHALMPWMTVMGNIAFGVKSKWPDWNAEKIRTRCQE